MIYFCKKARTLGLSPVVLEYPDRFVGFNVEKKFLRVMPFIETVGLAATVTHKLFKRGSSEGRLICEIETATGELVIDFHHDLLQGHLSDPPTVIDQTIWFGSLKQFFFPHYSGFLSTFISHGVLFENFLMDDVRESRFLSQVIYPGFLEIVARFGLRPLVFRHLPMAIENKIGWQHYPFDLLPAVERRLALSNHMGT